MGGGGSCLCSLEQQEVASGDVCMQNLEAVHCIHQGWGKRGSKKHLSLVCGLLVAFLVGKSLEELQLWSWLLWRSSVSLCKETESWMGSGYGMSLFSIQDAFSDLALFFYDKHGGEVIAVLWKPLSFQPQPFKVSF